MLEKELENPLPAGAPAPTLQTILFREAVDVQFLRFDLVSYWGNLGGGLDYFAVITVSVSTGGDVLPYMSVIIVTALLCSALGATVYLVIRRRREVAMTAVDDNPVYGDYHNGPEYNIAVDNNSHY